MHDTSPMKKQTALELLGGTAASAARLIGCTNSSVHAWPNPLPRRIADRVLAARLRFEWRVAREQAGPEGLEVHPLIEDCLN